MYTGKIGGCNVILLRPALRALEHLHRRQDLRRELQRARGVLVLLPRQFGVLASHRPGTERDPRARVAVQRGGDAVLGFVPRRGHAHERQGDAHDPQHGQHGRVSAGGVHRHRRLGGEEFNTLEKAMDERPIQAQPRAAVSAEGRDRVQQLRHHRVPDPRQGRPRRRRGVP